MSQRLRAWLHALLAAALFAAALAILHHELREVHYRDLLQAVAALPRPRLLWAIVLCIASYAVLTGYDQLAFRLRQEGDRALAHRRGVLRRRRDREQRRPGAALRSVGAVPLLHALGHRRRRPLPRRPVLLELPIGSGCWLSAAGASPSTLTRRSNGTGSGRPVAAPGRAAGGDGRLSGGRRDPSAAARVRRLEIAIPSFRLALAQLALSMLDWALATAVLYALLPAGGPSFGVLLGAFLAAQLIGMVSQVPGGVGVFEGVMLIELAQFYRTEQILSALLLYRVIYYLLPLCAGLAVLVGDEIRVHRHRLARIGAMFGNATLLVAPKVLAVFTFLAGVVLLFSGATPAHPGRLAALARFLPLGVFEASHFLGSIVGVALLVVAQGVARRLGRRLLRRDPPARPRHRVLAAQGRRLGGGGAPVRSCCSLSCPAARTSSAGRRSSRRVSRRDGRWRPGRLRGLDLARAVRLPPRRVPKRAVVALRARPRRAAFPARFGGRGGDSVRGRRRAPDAAGAPRGCRRRRRIELAGVEPRHRRADSRPIPTWSS